MIKKANKKQILIFAPVFFIFFIIIPVALIAAFSILYQYFEYQKEIKQIN